MKSPEKLAQPVTVLYSGGSQFGSQSTMAITIKAYRTSKFFQENSGLVAGLRSDNFLPDHFYFIIP
jgi:hypothetical protein